MSPTRNRRFIGRQILRSNVSRIAAGIPTSAITHPTITLLLTLHFAIPTNGEILIVRLFQSVFKAISVPKSLDMINLVVNSGNTAWTEFLLKMRMFGGSGFRHDEIRAASGVLIVLRPHVVAHLVGKSHDGIRSTGLHLVVQKGGETGVMRSTAYCALVS